MLNENLRLLREANNYKQRQIADLLGINRATYASYETGRNKPNYHILEAFAKIFGVTVDYLINQDLNTELAVFDSALSLKKEEENSVVSQLKDDERELLAMYRLCPDETKEKVKEILEKAKKEELKKPK